MSGETRVFKKIDDISQKYIMNRSIGLGSFSEVKLAMHKQAGTMVAVKIIRKELMDLTPSNE